MDGVVDTVKVKAWGEGQGAYVVINKADFSEGFHQLFDEATAPPAGPTEADLAAERAKTEEAYKREADAAYAERIAALTTMKVVELQAVMAQMSLEVPTGANKADLVRLIVEAESA